MKSKTHIKTIRRTFIDPFQDFKRNLLYLGSFLGIFGFSLMNTISSYDLGTAGLGAIMSYFAPALLLAGFIYWPLLYMGFSAFDGIKWRLFIFALQTASILTFISLPQEPLLQGLFFGVTMAPFWTAHHIAMVQNTTKSNRGYEVSIGHFIFLTGGVCAALSSAYFLENINVQTGLLIALTSLIVATTCLLASSQIVRQHTVSHFIKECRRVARDNPYMARRIISQSLFDAATFTLAALMHIMGISPTIMATIIVSRLILMFILSPVIGTLAHKYRRHSYGLGLALVSVGWLILAVTPSEGLAFFLCLMFVTIGISIATSSLMAGLYQMQSYATMMWSEVFLAVGRGAGLLLLVPIMYINVRLYLCVLAAVALGIFVVNRHWLRTYKNEVLNEEASADETL